MIIKYYVFSDDDELTDKLREAQVNILTNQECKNEWGPGIVIADDSHICTNT